MTPDIKAQLDYEGAQPGEFVTQMLSEALSFVKMSRGHMAKYYDKWDENALTYCG